MPVRWSAVRVTLLVAVVAAPALPVHADAVQSPYALGDWGGSRARLADEGVTFNVNYVSELAHNQTGGTKELTRHTGQLTLDSILDMGKLVGWDGATVRMTVTERDGNSLNDDAGINALMPIQEVYGRNQTWRLTQLWLQQDFLDGKLQLKLGRLGPGSDFSLWDCSFMNITFCGGQNGNIVSDYWMNWPISQWGALGTWHISGTQYLRGGVYQVNPSYLETRHSLDLYHGGSQGNLFPLEYGWNPRTPDGLQGSYSLGGWYTNYRQPDVYTDIDGSAAALTGLEFATRTGAYGAYITAHQQLTHGSGVRSDSGLTVFFEATQADRQTSTVDRSIAAGFTYTGIGHRTDDQVGVGLGTTHINSRLGAYQRDIKASATCSLVQGSEFTAEVFYGAQLKRWLVIRPDLQWIQHPGGVASRSDVYVIGAKSVITF
jgi:porin